MTKEDADGRLILSKKRARFEKAWKRIEAPSRAASRSRARHRGRQGRPHPRPRRARLPARLAGRHPPRAGPPGVRGPGDQLPRHRDEPQPQQRGPQPPRRARGGAQGGPPADHRRAQRGRHRRGHDQQHRRLRRVRRPRRHRRPHPHLRAQLDAHQPPVRGAEDQPEGQGQGARHRPRPPAHQPRSQADPGRPVAEDRRQHKVGDVVEGRVTKIVAFGAFVEIYEGIEGLVHISELANRHVERPDEVVVRGDEVKVKIIEVDSERRRLSLRIKRVDGDNLSPHVGEIAGPGEPGRRAGDRPERRGRPEEPAPTMAGGRRGDRRGRGRAKAEAVEPTRPPSAPSSRPRRRARRDRGARRGRRPRSSRPPPRRPAEEPAAEVAAEEPAAEDAAADEPSATRRPSGRGGGRRGLTPTRAAARALHAACAGASDVTTEPSDPAPRTDRRHRLRQVHRARLPARLGAATISSDDIVHGLYATAAVRRRHPRALRAAVVDGGRRRQPPGARRHRLRRPGRAALARGPAAPARARARGRLERGGRAAPSRAPAAHRRRGPAAVRDRACDARFDSHRRRRRRACAPARRRPRSRRPSRARRAPADAGGGEDRAQRLRVRQRRRARSSRVREQTVASRLADEHRRGDGAGDAAREAPLSARRSRQAGACAGGLVGAAARGRARRAARRRCHRRSSRRVPARARRRHPPAARRNDLDPALVAAVIYAESAVRRARASSQGAVGLMQILPETAEQIAERVRRRRRSCPPTSRPAGQHPLRLLLPADALDRYDGDLRAAVAAYNAGDGRSAEWQRGRARAHAAPRATSRIPRRAPT